MLSKVKDPVTIKLNDGIWLHDPEIKIIADLLIDMRLVGGCVRDYLIFGGLSDDIDIATPLLPEEVSRRLSVKFQVIPTGIKHGTVTAIGKNKKYEITTLRKDTKTFGRHAEVEFMADWYEDSARRDFTMNALFADMQGNVIDFHGGLKDIENRIVRFIGDPEKRIQEDYLRIMRFFRFSARYSEILEDNGLKACWKFMENLKTISDERITQEWVKIIETDKFWEIMPDMLPIMQSIGFETSIWQYIKNRKQLSSLGIIAMFWRAESKLRLSNEQMKYVQNLQKLPFRNIRDIKIMHQKYGSQFAMDKMILSNKIKEYEALPEFPLSGRDLKVIGFQDGPKLGMALSKIYKIWVRKNGDCTKQECLELARRLKL